MSKYAIFLDDERNVSDVTWVKYPEGLDWCVVRTMRDFMFVITQAPFEDISVISFDHDIADYNADGCEVTGYDCLKWLVEYCLENDEDLPDCIFHTQNIIGKLNMESYYANTLAYQEMMSWN